MSRARRLALLAATSLLALLTLAPAAIAADGVGLWGRTDDKVITYFSFAVMAFFATMPYGKFAHGIYRGAALLKWAIEKRQPSRLTLGSE